MAETKPKILIVDDEPNNQRSYERILEPLNLDIEKALSGHKALEVAYMHDFFLILMDVQMPDMDGFETASLILEHPKTRHIPVIFITAMAKDDTFEFEGYKRGAVDYMTKPINDDILRSKIKIFLELYRQKKQLQESEKKIHNLLNEKEMLLKEVHHRIKNNMFAIMTLLSMQSDSLDNPEAVIALQDASARVESMMVLYNKLYRTENYKEVSIKDYLSKLIEEILQLFPDRQNIRVEIQIDDFLIGSKQMFPLGLIINELLTNAMKYAFAGRDNGLIEVDIIKKENYVTFTFKDNGIGMPGSLNYSDENKGFGLTLIELLTGQIDAAYKVETDNGTKFTFGFEI
ncbi:MAG: response regulator [Spirochaetales bacterium]|nr:response regulator [Spirochaetales bacterium]